MEEAIKKADILIEALPYIKKFHKKIMVIKYGGSILGEERIRKSVLEDIAFLRYTGIRPILVHGGGPNITERLKKLKFPSKFIEGFRVTDSKTLKIVEEELNNLNDLIVEEITSHGIKAKGFKKDDRILLVKKKKSKKDLGFVGEVVDFNRRSIEEVLKEAIPVVCPMGISDDNTTYNINADEVAFFLASYLPAEKVVFLTNVLGVMRDSNNEDSLISTLTVKEAEDLIKEKVIDEGMVPKVKAAIEAIKHGVKKAHIIDAKIPHAILLEIFTDEGIGTEIIP
ncbi:MAG: acetylglutamate kinase [Candidatus Omnitrophica bacterium]|nr:acetylglutamate kinase [Candidatus Omnitrophota bacterium]